MEIRRQGVFEEKTVVFSGKSIKISGFQIFHYLQKLSIFEILVKNLSILHPK